MSPPVPFVVPICHPGDASATPGTSAGVHISKLDARAVPSRPFTTLYKCVHTLSPYPMSSSAQMKWDCDAAAYRRLYMCNPLTHENVIKLYDEVCGLNNIFKAQSCDESIFRENVAHWFSCMVPAKELYDHSQKQADDSDKQKLLDLQNLWYIAMKTKDFIELANRWQPRKKSKK
eukprot:792654-Rhodomonas_salina.1